MKRLLFLALAWLAAALASPAMAQAPSPVYQSWFPTARDTMTATTVSAPMAFPPNGGNTVRICNRGTTDTFLAFGRSDTVTASAATGYLLEPGLCHPYNLNPSGQPYTWFAAVTASGSNAIYIETGIGTALSLNLTAGNGGGGGAPTGPAGGDLGGTYPNPDVLLLNGNTPGGICDPGKYVTGVDSSARPSCGTPPGSGTMTQLNAGIGMAVSPGVAGGNVTTSGTIFPITLPVTKTDNYTFANADGSGLFFMNAATAKAFTLPQATATGNFAAGWAQNIGNLGAGALTVQATVSTITPTLPALATGQGVSVASDGTNYKSFGLSLPQMAAGTILANFTGGTAYPIANALTTCTGAGKALTFDGSAIGCNTISASSPAFGFALNNNSNSLPAQITSTAMQFGCADADPCRILGDSFGAAVAYNGRRANGTNASKTTLVAGDVITALSARGYDGTGYSSASDANIQMVAASTWTTSNHEAYAQIQCTPNGSIIVATCAQINSIGLMTASAGAVPTAALTIGSNGRATGLKIFNIEGANGEDGFINWSSNIFQIGTEKAGSGSGRQTRVSGTSVILNTATGTNLNMQVNGSTVSHVQSTGLFMDAGQFVNRVVTVATLPTGVQGGQAAVSDATSCTAGATPTGGGTTFCPLIYTGAAWVSFL